MLMDNAEHETRPPNHQLVPGAPISTVSVAPSHTVGVICRESSSDRSPFRFASMIKPEHRWRLIVRDELMIAKIMKQSANNVPVSSIGRCIGMKSNVVKLLIEDLTE